MLNALHQSFQKVFHTQLFPFLLPKSVWEMDNSNIRQPYLLSTTKTQSRWKHTQPRMNGRKIFEVNFQDSFLHHHGSVLWEKILFIYTEDTLAIDWLMFMSFMALFLLSLSSSHKIYRHIHWRIYAPTTTATSKLKIIWAIVSDYEWCWLIF